MVNRSITKLSAKQQTPVQHDVIRSLKSCSIYLFMEIIIVRNNSLSFNCIMTADETRLKADATDNLPREDYY